MMIENPSLPPTGRSRLRKLRNRTTKVIRRVHLYAGILLLPWLIFFGFSGMLFNHAEWFGPVEVVSSFDNEETQSLGNFSPLDATLIAEEVVSVLNAGEARYRLPADARPSVEGSMNYQGKADSGRVMVLLSPNHGDAHIRQFRDAPTTAPPPFPTGELRVPSFDPSQAERAAAALLREAGLESSTPLQPSERGGSEIRFPLETANGSERWQVVYNLAAGTLTARRADAPLGLDLYTVVSRLHKAHHYPDRMGARWLWTALADATGITMVFWGVSGLIMWWQIKPTRVIGLAGLTITTVLAVAIFSGTFSDLTFGPPSSRAAGAQRPVPAPAAPESDRGPDREKGSAPKGGPSDPHVLTGPAE